MKKLTGLRLLAGAVGIALLAPLTGTGAAAAAGTSQSSVPSAVPSGATPHVLDNKVLDIAQVGNRIVVVGSFLQVRDAPANGGATYDQPSVFAFDAATGAIDRRFSPVVNGVVNAVEAGPGGTVYLGGTFSTVNGTTARNLVQLSVADGSRTAFRSAALNGAVNDLVLAGGRLHVGGVFNTAGGVGHGGLATLVPATGAVDPYMGVDVVGNHNYPHNGTARASVGVARLDVSPDGRHLVAIGNFVRADGEIRDQVALLTLGAAGAAVDPDWRTQRYQHPCFADSFDSYVRDVQFAPDGGYFVIVTTCGHNVGSLCDTAARWELADRGQDVQPRWVADAGGDTLYSVELTGTAVYVGGHQRWMNNVLGSDYPGPGALPRPGLVALDPRNGLPLSWNPGRHPRGVGAEALLATSSGLYVGSDTPYIGNRQYLRPRLAYFPLAGGAALPQEPALPLPANVYLGGRQSVVPGGTTGEVVARINAGGPALAPLDEGPEWAADDGWENPLRTTGSNSAGWGAVPTVDGTVPPTTPAAVFDSERWDPGDGAPMQWRIPAAVGTTVEVRLYLANRCGCTDSPGERIFDVTLDGTTVLEDYDISGDVGHDVGTMKSFVVTSDGTLDIGFGHVFENPLVNAIEVVESTGAGTPGPIGIDDLVARWYDGTSAGPDTVVGSGGMDWSKARGAFMVGDTLYYGYPAEGGAYALHQRSFDGASFGAATMVNPYHDPYWSDVRIDKDFDQTFRGTLPNFYGQLASVTSMVYRDGRLYYTRSGVQRLFYRGFTPDSGVVSAEEFTAAATGFADVAGAFLSGDELYTASRSTGELRRTSWAGGAPTGTGTAVSGPALDGRNWSTRALFTGPGDPPAPPNTAPTASFDVSCSGLTCRFDGSGSRDAEGPLAGYAWDFGDGSTGTGATVEHPYAAAGDRTVTLTVTDADGATAQAGQTVTVASPPAGTGIDLRGSEGTSARAVTSVTVDVPDGVQPGDGLVLVLSTNSAVTGAAPAGFTPEGSRTSGTAMTTQVFSAVATAEDAGRAVTVRLSGTAKVTAQLLAYRGTAADPVSAVAGADDTGGTAHTTPDVTVPSGSWVLSVWSDKQAAARQFVPPSAGATARNNLAGVGTGDVATLVADSGAAVSGAVRGTTATVATASTRATMLSVVLVPGTGTPPPPPPNEAPRPVVAHECAGLSCAFDGSGSSDPDGTVRGYVWDFGDGTGSTAAAPAHTYAAAGEYAVRLTVTDDDGTSATAQTLVGVAAAPPPAAGIGLRGTSGTSARAVTSLAVDVPSSVTAGNGLVLVLSTNNARVATAPAGWTATHTQPSGTGMTTQVFSRVAGSGDAGTQVTVPLGGTATATLQLAAYSGTAASGPVASVVGAAGAGGTEHRTPAATAGAGDWVLSVWSDKQPVARQWTPTSGVTERSNLAGAGTGDLATLLADSGAPVAAGAVGGATATVPTASSRWTVLTLVLDAA